MLFVTYVFFCVKYRNEPVALGLAQPVTEMNTRNISWGAKAAGAWSWQHCHLQVPTVLKSGRLNLLEPSGPIQAYTRIILGVLLWTKYCADTNNNRTCQFCMKCLHINNYKSGDGVNIWGYHHPSLHRHQHLNRCRHHQLTVKEVSYLLTPLTPSPFLSSDVLIISWSIWFVL